ncbi:1741_t:CDS:1 [Racocetra persica]|uniref:1741_t:CDS:1 n=1 Tax=Racocetra persica TaxID=160502 RepID=A0ACA9MUZ7_9GLOM|nr:1741_t:CDS:1 [Racocetra persica]
MGNTEINEDSSYMANKETGEPENRFTKDNPIYKLFQRVFVNDSWSCASPIEKPYYLAGIFPPVCFLCGNRDVTNPSKGERPLCARCGENLYQKSVISGVQVRTKRENSTEQNN